MVVSWWIVILLPSALYCSVHRFLPKLNALCTVLSYKLSFGNCHCSLLNSYSASHDN